MSSYALVRDVYGPTPLPLAQPVANREPSAMYQSSEPSPWDRSGSRDRSGPRDRSDTRDAKSLLQKVYRERGILGIAALLSDDMLRDLKNLICVSKRMPSLGLSSLTNEHILLALVVVVIFLMILKAG